MSRPLTRTQSCLSFKKSEFDWSTRRARIHEYSRVRRCKLTYIRLIRELWFVFLCSWLLIARGIVSLSNHEVSLSHSRNTKLDQTGIAMLLKSKFSCTSVCTIPDQPNFFSSILIPPPCWTIKSHLKHLKIITVEIIKMKTAITTLDLCQQTRSTSQFLISKSERVVCRKWLVVESSRFKTYLVMRALR